MAKVLPTSSIGDASADTGARDAYILHEALHGGHGVGANWRDKNGVLEVLGAQSPQTMQNLLFRYADAYGRDLLQDIRAEGQGIGNIYVDEHALELALTLIQFPGRRDELLRNENFRIKVNRFAQDLQSGGLSEDRLRELESSSVDENVKLDQALESVIGRGIFDVLEPVYHAAQAQGDARNIRNVLTRVQQAFGIDYARTVFFADSRLHERPHLGAAKLSLEAELREFRPDSSDIDAIVRELHAEGNLEEFISVFQYELSEEILRSAEPYSSTRNDKHFTGASHHASGLGHTTRSEEAYHNAQTIHAATEGGWGWGVNAQDVLRVLSMQDGHTLPALEQAYRDLYGKDLEPLLTQEFTFTNIRKRRLLANIFRNPGKALEHYARDILSDVRQAIGPNEDGTRERPLYYVNALAHQLEGESGVVRLMVCELFHAETGQSMVEYLREAQANSISPHHHSIDNDAIARLQLVLAEPTDANLLRSSDVLWSDAELNKLDVPPQVVNAFRTFDAEIQAYAPINFPKLRAALERLSPEESQVWMQVFGNQITKTLDETFASNLRSRSEISMVRHLVQQGGMSDSEYLAFELDRTKDSFFRLTHVEEIRGIVSTKSANEIQSLIQDYAYATHTLFGELRDLQADLTRALSGRDEMNIVDLGLKGVPDLSSSSGIESLFARAEHRFQDENFLSKTWHQHVAENISWDDPHGRLIQCRLDAFQALDEARHLAQQRPDSASCQEAWQEARNRIKVYNRSIDAVLHTQDIVAEMAIEMAVGTAVTISTFATAGMSMPAALSVTAGVSVRTAAAASLLFDWNASFDRHFARVVSAAFEGISVDVSDRLFGVLASTLVAEVVPSDLILHDVARAMVGTSPASSVNFSAGLLREELHSLGDPTQTTSSGSLMQSVLATMISTALQRKGQQWSDIVNPLSPGMIDDALRASFVAAGKVANAREAQDVFYQVLARQLTKEK